MTQDDHYRAHLEARPDGSFLYSSVEPLAPYPEVLTDRVLDCAVHAPDRLLIARRNAGGDWAGVTYGQAAHIIRALGQALLERDLSAERPIVILTGASVNHALLMLAAMQVGIPVAPVAPAYATASQDFVKLRHVLSILTPGMVFVEDMAGFERAFAAVLDPSVELVAATGEAGDRPVTPFAALLETAPTTRVEEARRAVHPDDVAKFLFTSGSTGMPKAAPNTHRMICSNQQMLAQVFPFVTEAPPVFLDWLPWHHTFGGNQNLGMALYNGGSFYIDDGRPVGDAIAITAANLKEIAPTIYFNVPKGYEMLLPFLQADAELARNLFSRTRVFFYSGAALPASVWAGYPALGEAVAGRTVPLVTSLGCTETAPCSIAARRPADAPGELGIPAPGVEARLVPVDGKLELRIRGPNVMSGYWRQPERSAAVFDEEGFYRMGDAVKFADPADPDHGLRFDGRISEDFKLSSGVWVNVAAIRMAVIHAFTPLARDAIVAGADRDDIRALLILDEEACLKALAGEGESEGALAPDSPGLKALLAERLAGHRVGATGSSTRAAAVAVLNEALSMDAGEVTDKGSLNGRLILERRPELLGALYRDDHPHTVRAKGMQ